MFQERELQRQRELMQQEQEREIRRQEMAVMKAIEARKKMEVSLLFTRAFILYVKVVND